MNRIIHDFDATYAFLQALDPQAEKFAIQLIADQKDTKIPLSLRKVLHLTIAETIELMKEHNTVDSGLGVFFAVNQTDGLGRKSDNIVRVRALFLDIDKDGSSTIEKLKGNLSPNVIVKTSKGKFHLYWFAQNVVCEEFKSLQQVIAKQFCGDPAVCDLPRIMRLPGSIHLKNAPQLVKPSFSKNLKPYSRDEIITGLKLDHQNIIHGYDDNLFDASFNQASSIKLRAKFGDVAIGNNTGEIGWYDRLTPQDKEICLRQMLSILSSVANGSRETWLRVLMAAWASGAPNAQSAARDWSSTSPKHTDAEFEKTWASFKPRKNGVTIGSLIHMATECRWDSSLWRDKIKSAQVGVGSSYVTQVGQPLMDPWDKSGAPPFPTDVLPVGLRNLVDYLARSMGCTGSAIAICALAAISAALTQKAQIRITQHSCWLVRVRFWLMLVGDPSSMKSPLLNVLFGEHERIDGETIAAAKFAHNLWVQSKEIAKSTNSAFSAIEPGEPARLILRDTTTEVVANILSRDPRGSNVLRDELAGWLGSMDRYSNRSGGDRPFWLQSFNGGNYTKDRVGKGQKWGDGSVFVENCSLNVIGGIQPNRLREAADLTDDGLLQRFIPVILDPAVEGEDIPDTLGSMPAYNDMIRLVYSLQIREPFYYDTSAQIICARVMKFLKDWQRASIYGDGFSQWLGKLNILYGTLCVVLHITDAIYELMAKHPRNEQPIVQSSITFKSAIPEEVALRAERILNEYIIRAGALLYGQIICGEVSELTQAIASYILTADKSRFVTSDFTVNIRAMRGMDAFSVYKHLSALVAGGWLVEEQSKGRYAAAWVVTSDLRQRFREKVASERLRKEEVMRKIMEASS